MPVLPEAAFYELRQLQDGLHNGEFTSVELTEFYLNRCETLGPRLNAVVTVLRDRAVEMARTCDEERKAGRPCGPLHGIPFGAKDLLALPGVPTTWGAAPYRDRTIDVEASILKRLREAGAVLIAKLSMVEIAGGMGYRSADAAFNGPGRNPWNIERWSGGSSSGSGSAVGAGLIPYAIGSETWGSITTPAGYCGVTGLRPTYGLVSRYGAMTLSWTMDKIGPLARTAADALAVLDVISGTDPNDLSTVERPAVAGKTQERPVVAIIKGAADKVQPEVAANFNTAVEVLREFCTIEETELPELPYNEVADLIIAAEAAAAHEELVTSGQIAELAAPEDRWRVYPDLMVSAVDYLRALRVRTLIMREMDEFAKRYAAIVTPTLATVAGPVDLPFGEWSKGFETSQIGAASNLAGIPAVTIPDGFGAEHLPTGLQLVGRAFEERAIVAIAEEYQRRTKWHLESPPEFSSIP
jgi:aspartyl-tRNA(Asn)/glutamyl-tRNA(Gln) amidotransferase subunit A